MNENLYKTIQNRLSVNIRQEKMLNNIGSKKLKILLFFARLIVTLQLKKNENEETYDIFDAVLLRNGGDEC